MLKISIIAFSCVVLVATMGLAFSPSHECSCDTHAACLENQRILGTCPFCNFSTSWTGRTETINAKIWYVMKCVQGHETLSQTPSHVRNMASATVHRLQDRPCTSHRPSVTPSPR